MCVDPLFEVSIMKAGNFEAFRSLFNYKQITFCNGQIALRN